MSNMQHTKSKNGKTYCQEQKPNNLTRVIETQILQLLAKELR